MSLSHTLTNFPHKILGGLEGAFLVLRDLAVEAGAPEGLELIQSRDSENTILIGLPGKLDAIAAGTFPPPVVVWVPSSSRVAVQHDDDDDEEEEGAIRGKNGKKRHDA